jgi:OOP family OmpA-OmpF porin
MLAVAAATSGCAARADRGGFNCDRRWGGGTIGGALVGAAIGGGLGGGIAATSGETEKQAEDLAVGIGVGAVAGAAIGAIFGHCAFDPHYAEMAPPPPPPPPPPPSRPPMHRKIVLRGVNFDFDKATIRRDAADVLDEAAEILRDQPNVDIAVDGHTDAIGGDAYNQKLSERRAAAVASYLAAHGVTASRLHTRGYGESHPVASNDTDEGRAQNRRVELNVVGDERNHEMRYEEREEREETPRERREHRIRKDQQKRGEHHED